MDRNCISRHGQIDQRIEKIVDKLDVFSARLTEFGEKMSAKVDRLFFAVLALLTSVCLALLKQLYLP